MNRSITRTTTAQEDGTSLTVHQEYDLKQNWRITDISSNVKFVPVDMVKALLGFVYEEAADKARLSEIYRLNEEQDAFMREVTTSLGLNGDAIDET
jgi:hypothetical protein